MSAAVIVSGARTPVGKLLGSLKDFTAASASQISDGACAVVVMSQAKAAQLGAEVLAEIGPHGNVAGPDNSLHSQPSGAIMHALGKAGGSVGELDLIEINEAFAAVAIQSMKDLGVGPGAGQCQWRRDRDRPSDRRVRGTDRPAPDPLSCGGAAVAWARRRCAAVAARATRCCCGYLGPRRQRSSDRGARGRGDGATQDPERLTRRRASQAVRCP